MSDVLHPVYLPFTEEQLIPHFAPVGTDKVSPSRHLDYYCKSIQAATDYTGCRQPRTPAEEAKAKAHGLQMQKDERFWTVTALLSIFSAPDRAISLMALLQKAFPGGFPPMDGLASCEQALGDPGKLELFFEVSLPTPPDYRKALAAHLEERVLTPHVLDSAMQARATGQALEGATKADALLVSSETGFALLFESKVLADASGDIRFDVLRNQLARNIDVMLDINANLQKPLTLRQPGRTCFVLLTPEIFRDHPESRLYGWLIRDYQTHAGTLQRDLPHRAGTDLASVAKRLGWLTWEDCNRVQPGACSWLPETG
jgi:hypothetical protein